MKVSMRTDYAARALVDLAQHYGMGPIQSSAIAARQAIPEAYLEQLLTALRKAGLVRSTRGPQGGHELARHPSRVTVAELVRALEGDTAPISCLDPQGSCQVSLACALQDVWQSVHEAAQRVMDATTIEYLAHRQEEREAKAMYYI